MAQKMLCSIVVLLLLLPSVQEQSFLFLFLETISCQCQKLSGGGGGIQVHWQLTCPLPPPEHLPEEFAAFSINKSEGIKEKTSFLLAILEI